MGIGLILITIMLNSRSSSSSRSIICLTSLSHSGSTVFSMALACHQYTVSLGEVYQVLRKGPQFWLHANNNLCSCGQSADTCEFWGPTLRKLINNDVVSPTAPDYFQYAYRLLLDEFARIYPDTMRPIDTSKGVKHLTLLAKDTHVHPSVVFLIRDVRSYAFSQTRLARSQNRKGIKKVKGHHWYQMLRWLKDNRQRESLLTSLQLPYTTAGYEPFCFDPSAVLADTDKFLTLPQRQATANLAQSKHHVLFGNPMRHCETRKKHVHYDHRWFNDTDYLAPAALLPFVMKYNKHKVYGNGL